MRVDVLVDLRELTDFEIVIGLVAPIGTNLDLVTTRLKEQLHLCGYGSDVIRLSHLLDDDDTALPSSASSPGYYEKRMNAGDALRGRYKSGDAVAARAVASIRARRGEGVSQASRRAWVLRTIKHEDEVALLRATYRRRFVLVGVFQAETSRRERLKAEHEDQNPGAPGHDAAVSVLIERDQMDAFDPYGQRVREAFALADYFLDADRNVADDVERLVRLLFGDPFITPTRDEMSMFLASGTALRSSDAGRQVGAVITTAEGEVLATGTNEVPKAGGGEYWPGDKNDARDFQRGHDFNRRMMHRTVTEFLDVLAQAGHLNAGLSALASEERLPAVRSADGDGRLKSTRLMSLIEFGRITHAEMAAITQASRTNHSTRGCTLYTTAFPCHMCMRLIISAGINRIVYVDPYPKSLAIEMYYDSLRPRPDAFTVKVESFTGAAPRVFADVFRASNRERDERGDFVEWDRPTSRMKLAETDPLLGSDDFERQIAVALVPPGDWRVRDTAGVGGGGDAVTQSRPEED